MKSTLVAVVSLLSVAMVVSGANGPPEGPRVCIKNTESGVRFPIHVDLDREVSEVKKTISMLTAKTIPVHIQKLLFKGQTLEDAKSLKDYNIEHHSDLELAYDSSDFSDDHGEQMKPIRTPIPRDKMHLATLDVWTPGTLTFTVEVDLNGTVGELKKIIEKQEEYAVNDQQIFYKNYAAPLDNSKTLASYKIYDSARILLRVPPSWCHLD